jgi:hypothetical protein
VGRFGNPPLSERFWWIRIHGVVGWALAGFVMLVVGMILPATGNGPFWPRLAIAIGASMLIACWARFDAVRDARMRTLRRRLALRGDVDAIPTPRIVSDPASVPDSAARPLVLRWARRWFEYRVVLLQGYIAWAASLTWFAVLALTLFRGTQLPGVLAGIGIGSILAANIFLRSFSGPFRKPHRRTGASPHRRTERRHPLGADHRPQPLRALARAPPARSSLHH